MRHVAGAVVVLVLALGGCGDDTQEPLDNGAINNGTNNGANNGGEVTPGAAEPADEACGCNTHAHAGWSSWLRRR